MSASEPCDKHELTNCAICNGDAARQAASFRNEYEDTGVLPIVPGCTVIASQFPGTCSGCGRWYPENTPIARPRGEASPGWLVVDCCAGLA